MVAECINHSATRAGREPEAAFSKMWVCMDADVAKSEMQDICVGLKDQVNG